MTMLQNSLTYFQVGVIYALITRVKDVAMRLYGSTRLGRLALLDDGDAPDDDGSQDTDKTIGGDNDQQEDPPQEDPQPDDGGSADPNNPDNVEDPTLKPRPEELGLFVNKVAKTSADIRETEEKQSDTDH